MSVTAMTNKVFTIGHSSHPIDVFLNLLKSHHVDAIADTRSYPRSKFAPQYNSEILRKSLKESGIQYIYMGELGGRPEGAEFYDEAGHVLYSRVAESAVFRSGLERLEREIQKLKLALLCSEENPSICHRRLLIARVLKERGVPVEHIRADGRVETEEELMAGEAGLSSEDSQLALFEHSRIPEWKSIPSVLQKRRQSNSSAS
jgi:uncharacterized protein (DUF488 family)